MHRAAVPGATTADLDAAAREVLERRNARSNFLGYHGFPAVACVSPNEVIVHGIPGARVLEEGDIVSIDCGAIIEGWHADAAITVPVGEVDDESQRLMDVTRAALEAAIPPRSTGIASATSAPRPSGRSTAAGFGVVREYVGHGIGTAMHEEPDVPNYGPAGPGDEAPGRDRAGHRADGHCGPGHDPHPRRRLDGRHRRRLPRRPLRAHRGDHGQWPRDPHRARDPGLAARA